MTRRKVFLLVFSLLTFTLMACFPPASCQVTLGNPTPELASPTPTAEELEMRRALGDQVGQRTLLVIAVVVLSCVLYLILGAALPGIVSRARKTR